MGSLILHVGLGKTGSSYLQQSLHEFTEDFPNPLFHYPSDSPCMPSGNGHLLLDAVEEDDTSFFDKLASQFCSIISREHFARELSCPTLFYKLRDILSNYYSPDQIHVVVYIREPSTHCFSLWSQKIKNRKTSLSVSSFSRYYDSYSVLSSFLLLATQSHWKITLRDYDQYTFNLLSSFLDSIPLPLIYPPITLPQINKSPSYSSLMAIRISSLLSSLLQFKILPSNIFIRLIAFMLPQCYPSHCIKYIFSQYTLYRSIKSIYG